MSGFFERLFSMGQSEAHGILDKLEDPVKMTEQGIRDLNKDLEQAKVAFAQIKALAIRAERDAEKAKIESNDWERKAMALLQQSQQGRLEQSDAERLATEALKRKEEAQKLYATHLQAADTQNQTVSRMQKNIERLKSQVSQYENELKTLKARATTAKATEKINRQLAAVDSSGTISMLERMKEKVEEQESLAEAYGEMAQAPGTVEDEINQTLLSNPDENHLAKELEGMKAQIGMAGQSQPANKELEALKQKMGI